MSRAAKLLERWRVRGLVGSSRLLVENLIAVADLDASHAFRYRANDIESRLFDLRWRVDTAGMLSPEALAGDEASNAFSAGYEATPAGDFHAMIRTLGIDAAQHSFLDLGSGKGRALLLASHYPFRKIVGVELSERLHRTALRNLRRYANPGRVCHDVRSVWGDALTFEPPTGPTLVYMYNPFRGEVVTRVLENLYRAERATTRPITVLYYQHSELKTVCDLPFVRLHGSYEDALSRGYSVLSFDR